jgi:choloylglycine hydrolase
MTYSQAVTDGMNEKGLAAHLLFLIEADYGQFDPANASLSISLWLQYYLDNFATVEEAVSFTRNTPFQIVSATLDGVKVGVHISLEDPTGDSAVIEYLDGKPEIYHGKKYTVMTNSPPYDEQLKNRAQYEGFGGNRPLPGTTKSPDRFVRASYYLKDLFKPENPRECVAGVLSVMRNVSQPFSGATSAPNPDQPNESTTRWLTVGDLTNRVYFYASTMTPNIIWVKLEDLDFSEGTSIRKLDLVNQPDRIGNCTKQFQPAEPFPVLPPDLD